MRYEEIIGQVVTRFFVEIMRSEVHLHYPNFYFEKGMILYDFDNERYVYTGYSEEETSILNEVARSLKRN